VTPQTVAILVSLVALAVSVGSFLSARQAAWSIRYYERWFQLARLVLNHSETLLPLWCSDEQYRQLSAKRIPPESEPAPEELVFAEKYVDFMLEVHRRGRIGAFLTGRFPGRVPLTNPRTLFLWQKYVISVYSKEQQSTIDRAISRVT
jgi:hypothetical protein